MKKSKKIESFLTEIIEVAKKGFVTSRLCHCKYGGGSHIPTTLNSYFIH